MNETTPLERRKREIADVLMKKHGPGLTRQEAKRRAEGQARRQVALERLSNATRMSVVALRNFSDEWEKAFPKEWREK